MKKELILKRCEQIYKEILFIDFSIENIKKENLKLTFKKQSEIVKLTTKKRILETELKSYTKKTGITESELEILKKNVLKAKKENELFDFYEVNDFEELEKLISEGKAKELKKFIDYYKEQENGNNTSFTI